MIIPQGVTGLGIYNAFDTSLQLIASKISDVQIDGIYIQVKQLVLMF
jgi:hypothetical protein